MARFESCTGHYPVESVMALNVSEIFKSIQGESTYAGLPYVFVRLGGCNLECSYCDTVYARDEYEPMEIDEIVRRVGEYGCSLVEVTGGEPLLQDATPQLLQELAEAGYRVLLETNGTMDIGGVPDGVIRIVDVKCPGSGMSDKVLWSNLEKLRPADEVKFVISDKSDYDWARSVIAERHLEARATVLMSPAWGHLAPRELARWILEDGLQVRVQVQLHKVIWPDISRGV